jgi:myo-inositol-1(or 4)-monophosphatase
VVSFYVDPIDGTSNFAAGLPLFCISIGVAVDDELVAGVIDAPILGQVFAAADGPATLNGREITPRPTRRPADALVLSGFPGQRMGARFPEYAAHATRTLEDSVSAVRHLGSAALELAYVAAGWADATGLSAINSWDVAAGFHILRRAGGTLRTWPGEGEADRPDHLQPAYAACTGQERLEVLDVLQDELQELRSAR